MSIISCCTNAMLNANIALKVDAFPLGNVLLALDYKLIRFLALHRSLDHFMMQARV